MPGQSTFEEIEFFGGERRRREVRVPPLEVPCGFATRAIPPRQGDMRMKGSALRLEANLDAGPVHLCR
jgi:hypothetical protein